MKPDRWLKIEQIFHAALQRKAEDRAHFLNQSCAGDLALYDDVKALLSSYENDDSFFEESVSALAAEMFADRVGETIGPYEVLSQLGSGAMGVVYLAQDGRLGRKIALKLLPSQFTYDKDRLRRFQQEARAASALNHPNILTVYEVEQRDGLHYIATEFVDGVTLRQHIQTRQLTLDEVLNIAIQVAGALQAAHAAGIAHRDIKPENIMIRSDGYIKVLDFGLAKLTENELSPAAAETNPGVVMGTPRYMSPEQARGLDVDSRTDLWSLGVVIYEMVSGRQPFQGETPSHVIVSILEHNPVPLSVDSKVPDELQQIVKKALVKNKDERYQKVEDLLVDLKRLRQRLEVDAAIEVKSASGQNGARGATTRIQRAIATDDIEVARTGAWFVPLVNTLKINNRAITLVTALVLITVIGVLGYWRYESNRRSSSIRSIAVIPFENQTQNPDSEYLSDGVSDALINHLSQLPGVKVTARSSSFKYKGKPIDLQEVASALGVDAVLTGRVSQRGDNILISVELMDARDKTQMWGDQYNRKMSELLVIQSDIATEIARRLRLQLTAGQQQQLVKRETVNLQAYELLLKARGTSKGNTESRKKAIDLYQQAIAIDPSFALAYADLSGLYDALITINELNPKEGRPKVEAAAQKAVELDDNLPEAHRAMAWVKISAWDWVAAERELKRAIELNPNYVDAQQNYGLLLRLHGKVDEAVAQFLRVRALDPLSASSSSDRTALTIFSITRQNEKALEIAKRILDADKESPQNHIRVGDFYTRLGRYREAIEEFQQGVKLGEDSPDVQTQLAYAYAKAGEHEKAREILHTFESGAIYASPVSNAWIHLGLGEIDQAFSALETAYANHDQQLIWLRGEFRFDELHSDPRYQDLVRRVGLSS